MINSEDRIESVVVDGCDQTLAEGIISFLKALSKSSSYTLDGKKYSVFNLLEDHVDTPYLDFESRYKLDQIGFSLQPSRMKDPVHVVPEKKDDYERLSKHEKIRFSLRMWEDRIRGMIKDKSIVPDECQESVESILFLVTKLRYYVDRNKKKGKIRRKKGGDPDHITTNIHLKPGNNECVLCWKPLPQLPSYQEDMAYDEIKKYKSNYCADHDRSTKKGWANYIRDRRYSESFNYELDNLSKPANSKYSPNAKWYIDESRRLGFAVGIPEIRKIVYHLVRSKLNTKRRLEIYCMKEQGLSNVQIASKLRISKQAVSKSLGTTAQKIEDVLHSPTRDESTEFEPYFEPWDLISPINGKTYPTLKFKSVPDERIAVNQSIFSSEELEMKFIYRKRRNDRRDSRVLGNSN